VSWIVSAMPREQVDHPSSRSSQWSNGACSLVPPATNDADADGEPSVAK
jgi:hypothetical protein